jgi:LemA protein
MDSMDLLLGLSLLVVMIPIALFLISKYNRMMLDRSLVIEQRSHIEAHEQEKKNLMSHQPQILKDFTKYEQVTLEGVIRARPDSAVSNAPVVHGVVHTGNDLPDLKADTITSNYQLRIQEIEQLLREERKQYNYRVTIYNQHIHRFPSVIFAILLRFKEEPYYKMEN